MNKKMMLLATALTALAFAALPAVASAGTPETHCPGGSASCAIEISGGISEWTRTSNSLHIECTGLAGTGTMGTTGGTIVLSFSGCKEEFFGKCGTVSSGSGVITTTTLPYDNVYTADNKTSPGVLITPAAGTSHLMTFKCGDGTHVVSGNGLIGSLSAPFCGSSAATLGLSFSQSSKGHQTHRQITGTGAIFDLTDNFSLSTFGTNTAPTVKVAGGGSISLTCP
jgi:hypothetical protein